MTDYVIAWAVAGVAAVGICVALFFAFRPWPAPRLLAPLLAATWFLIPWRFQDDPDRFAPAFIVLIFRGLFEPDGAPGPVGRTLALATGAAVAVFLIGGGTRMLLGLGRRTRSPSRRARQRPSSPPAGSGGPDASPPPSAEVDTPGAEVCLTASHRLK